MLLFTPLDRPSDIMKLEQFLGANGLVNPVICILSVKYAGDVKLSTVENYR